jgi:HEAT repeat protein
VAKHPVNPAHPSAKSAPQLIAELDTADYKRREEVKSSLIRAGDAALPAIFDALRAKTPKHVDFLTGVFCERGPAAASAVPELIRLFQDPAISPSVKHHFLQSLACVGKTSPQAQALLISLIKGGDDAMRPWAVMLLERFDSQEAVFALAGALSNSQRSVREAAAGVLSGMGPKAAPAVPALSKAMGQKGTYLSMLAGNALRAIGTREAMAEIKKHKTENDGGSSEEITQ